MPRRRPLRNAAPAPLRHRRRRGASLLEVMVAATILLVTSLGLAHAFTSAGLAGKLSARDEGARQSLVAVADELAGKPWSQLLAWNGFTRDFGAHTVVVEAHPTTPRLILVECAAIDDATHAVLARVATLRAAGS